MANDFDDYFEHARTDMLPKMKASEMSIVLGADEPDIKLCTEIGAAILLDKPLIVIFRPGMKVPANLRRVASAVLVGEMNDPAFKKDLQETITRVISNDQRARN